MQRGEVWWANIAPPAGTRPVLLLSRDQVYRVRTSATVALITTTVRNIPVEVSVGPQDGLPRASVVNCDEIYTVALSLLSERITELSVDKMLAVKSAIRFALDLDE